MSKVMSKGTFVEKFNIYNDFKEEIIERSFS